MEDNARLLAIGQNGLSLFNLDWNLEPAQPQGWDRRSEQILANFAARDPELYFSEKTLSALKKELAIAGLSALDENIVAHRLKEAVKKGSAGY
jgi:hypothetical protein